MHAQDGHELSHVLPRSAVAPPPCTSATFAVKTRARITCNTQQRPYGKQASIEMHGQLVSAKVQAIPASSLSLNAVVAVLRSVACTQLRPLQAAAAYKAWLDNLLQEVPPIVQRLSVFVNVSLLPAAFVAWCNDSYVLHWNGCCRIHFFVVGNNNVANRQEQHQSRVTSNISWLSQAYKVRASNHIWCHREHAVRWQQSRQSTEEQLRKFATWNACAPRSYIVCSI